jgi:hypothetical protein
VVTVPQGTATTLSPVITIDGASISPALGAAQNFAFLVPYTVIAEDGSTEQWIVTVKWEPLVPANIAADIAAYFAGFPAGAGGSAVDPIPLPVNINLASGWTALLTAIQTGGKYVALDLSACTGGAAEFDPGTANTGESKIASLVLPDTATSVKAGDYSNPTFKDFTALKSVTGGAVASIGDYAFCKHDTLTTVNFPAAISIGVEAFYYCTTLKTVNLPMATSIGNYAFIICDALEMVSLPAAISIGDGAFSDCDTLSTVNIPAATSIGEEAFSFCTSLVTINLPVATNIDSFTFWYCTSLTAISLPASLTTIGINPFMECTNLTDITVAAANTHFKAEGGKLLSKNGTALICWPTASGSVNLSGITNVGDSACYRCTDLTTINLPNAITIGTYAFYGCTSLTTITLPATHTIGRAAFLSCTALETVNLPVAESIGNATFHSTGTKALTVTLGATPPELGASMFDNVPYTAIGESGTKSVTVKVPASALASYGPSPTNTTADTWGNGFRGGGWNGTGMMDSGKINENINLTIEALP